MDVEFADEQWDQLETDPEFNAGFAREVVRAYRKLMQVIRAVARREDVLWIEVPPFRETQG